MRYIKTVVLVSILCMIFCLSYAIGAEDQEAPKIGFVKNDGANVRAGDNINFETLCKLKKGDPVKILDKRYSWFKITLPKTAYVYINKDYVDAADEEGIGTVNAANVNLRAGPDTKYSILGQVSKPEKVKVLSEDEGWYKIEPSPGAAGWIHSTQVTFEMELAKREESPEQKTEEAAPLMPKKEKKNMILKLGAPKPKGNLVFSGQDSSQ